jgi:hypothetical protein
MDPKILMQINEIYRNEVYSEETLSEAKEDESLTTLQKIRKRNKRDSESLVSRPGGQTDERRSYHKAGRGEKKEKGAKSAFGTMRHVGGPYNEELDLYDIVSEYLVTEGFCDSYEDADVIMANMSEEWRESIMEEVLDESRQPISRASREQISNIVGTTDAPYASFKNPEKQKSRVRKLITGLEKSDKSRQKGELPVGRMARKVHTLLSRPRRSGADKEADYARAEYIDDIMRNR